MDPTRTEKKNAVDLALTQQEPDDAAEPPKTVCQRAKSLERFGRRSQGEAGTGSLGAPVVAVKPQVCP
jgi:hypothetical protein